MLTSQRYKKKSKWKKKNEEKLHISIRSRSRPLRTSGELRVENGEVWLPLYCPNSQTPKLLNSQTPKLLNSLKLLSTLPHSHTPTLLKEFKVQGSKFKVSRGGVLSTLPHSYTPKLLKRSSKVITLITYHLSLRQSPYVKTCRFVDKIRESTDFICNSRRKTLHLHT